MQKLLRPVALLLLAACAASCAGSKGFSLKRGLEKGLDECLEMARKKKHDRAIKCLESYKSRHYGESGAAEAELAIADAYFAQKDYIVAAEAYNLFAEDHPFHPRGDYALYKAAFSAVKQAPRSIERDQTELHSALSRLNALAGTYPGSSFADEAVDLRDVVRLRLARQNFHVGRFYYRYSEYLAAIPRFETVITDYGGLGLDSASFNYLVRALVATDNRDLARRYFELYKSHYPEDAKTIRKMARLF